MVQRVEKAGAIRNEDGSYNIFVITPYRDISKQMVDLLERNGIEDAKRICGTIHTFQGREADTVILLLGGDPQKRNAVGAFAAKTPNLLNVAITRAKRRIHVIGDSALWSGARYFSELYRAL
jgi:superfamily I DNA and/or RNA helicase